MSALLRSGKILRLVSGLARVQNGNNSNANPQLASSCGGQSTGSGCSQNHINCDGGGGTGIVHSNSITSSNAFSAWSVQHLQSSLPAVSSTTDGDKQESLQAPIATSGKVTREEIEEIISVVEVLDSPAAANHAVLALRLCGNVLREDVPDAGERTDFVNAVWTRLEEEMGLKMGVAHYNALLSVYLENEHPFCPEHIQTRLSNHHVEANQTTLEALTTRYCAEGNMEGARKIMKTMHDKGYKIGRSVFHSLILGYSGNGNMESARDVVRDMAARDLNADSDTYLALCKGFAKIGDWPGLKEILVESSKKGRLSTSDHFQVIDALSRHGHKQLVSDVLLHMLSNDETESFVRSSKAAITSLISNSHDDVAFTVLQSIPKTSSREACQEFLECLVKMKRPVTKLLWFSEEMRRKNMIEGGLEVLLQSALKHDNFSLSVKLAEIYVQDGQVLTQEKFSKLLDLCNGSLEVLSTVKAVGGSLSEEDIKSVVIPRVEKVAEGDLLGNLEKTGMDGAKVVPALIDYYLEKGMLEDAKHLAASHKDYLKVCQRHLVQNDKTTPPPPQQGNHSEQMNQVGLPMVQIYDANVGMFQWAPLTGVCQTFRMEGRFWDLEQLLLTSHGNLRDEDRKIIYLSTLQCYFEQGLFDKALCLSRQLESEGLAFEFHQYHSLMSHFQKTFVNSYTQSPPVPSAATPTPSEITSSATATYPPSENCSSYPTTPSSCEEQLTLQTHYHKLVKKAICEKSAEEAYQAYVQLDKTGKQLNVTETSTLIELLVKEGIRVREAAKITEDMLRRNTYPMPKIFRFLLNRLASSGEVEAMTAIGQLLTPKVKKEVSFDNRLCNAYLSAGRGAEFLDLLHKELQGATNGNIQTIKDKFPRGGAMGLLESNPELVEGYAKLAEKFVEYDYVAPMNVLWIYYFINGRHDLARPLWDKYVKCCPQIMFQKICQTARAESSLDMAENLVDLLHNAHVTSGAQGIAYSCMLDIMSQSGDFKGGLDKLQSGLVRGVRLEDINRTALLRLKNGLESHGIEFPHQIPKKNYSGNERSLSPANME